MSTGEITTAVHPRRFRRGWLAGVFTLALIAIAAAALAVHFHRGAAANPSPDLNGGSALAPSAAGPGWSLSLAPTYSENDFVIALMWDASAPLIELVNTGTGQVQAKIQTSYNPFVLRRPSAHELLVSDNLMQQAGTGTTLTPRLLVFDTANKLALKQTISLPNRIMYTVYAPQAMALSSNERYLFYLTHEYRQDLPQCAGGGDAATCDANSVAVLDLNGGATKRAPLPQGCGYAALQQTSASSMVATCPDSGHLQVISAGGQVTQQVDFDAARGPEQTINGKKDTARAVFGYAMPDGQFGVILTDGTFLSVGSRGSTGAVRVLPAGMQVSPMGQVFALGDGHLLISYTTPGQGDPLGFVILDPSTLHVEQHFQVANATSLVPHDEAVLVLKTDGAIQSVDPGTGSSKLLPGRFDINAEPLVP